jgi:DNA-binding transcriptional ArsR family regulator
VSDRTPTPPLLPILRSAQQGQILAAILDDPDQEVTASELARRLRIPQPTVAREVKRARDAGIVSARTIGRSVLVSADRTSVYFGALRELMVRAFGVPRRLADAHAGIEGIEHAYLFGSWAARYLGEVGPRPRDLDVLVLGKPDDSAVFTAVEALRGDLGYDIQVTICAADWLQQGQGSFHDTVVSRPMVAVFPVPH